MSTITKIVNLVVIDALWLIFCIPIITAGASTTAFYYTIQKNIKYNRGYTAQCFWDSFKENFKLSTGAWLIFLAFLVAFIFDIGIVEFFAEVGRIPTGLDTLFYILIVLVLLYAIWVFAYIARFENTFKNTLKNAAILAISSLPVSIVMFLLITATGVIVWLLPPAVLIMPGVCLWFISILTEKVFRRNMTEEERREEDERNMEWSENLRRKK